jgi:serine phosphatase RsbU (regulator of sigma subunit)
MSTYSPQPISKPSQPEPATAPPVKGAEIAARHHQVRVGGDWYDFVRVGPRLIFTLLDVAGDHKSSLPITAGVQNVFRDRSADLFSVAELNESETLAELALQMNHAIIQESKGPRCTATFLCSFHEELGTAWYICAGHVPPVLKDASGVSELSATGLPLGLFAHSLQDARVSVVEPGAILLAVSRGLLEAAPSHWLGRHSEEFGIERLKQTLSAATVSGATALCSFILDTAEAYAGRSAHKPPENDMTALALTRDGKELATN